MPITDYGNPSYWEERYAAEEESYDWYQDYSTLRPYVAPYLRRNVPDFEILIPGCGNSSLGPDLYDDGFQNITNVDLSSVVISQMHDKYREKEEMEYTVMDARNMEYIPNDCFDVIIDKALFDTQLCGDNNISSVQELMKEMYRVLKPGGVYCVVSHGGPDTRTGYLQRGARWTVEYASIPKPEVPGVEEKGPAKNHFLYTCRKPVSA